MFTVRNSALRTIRLNGDPGADGGKIGRLLKLDIRKVISRNKKFLVLVRKKHLPLIELLENKIRHLFPDAISELRAIAAASATEFTDLFLWNCPELLEKEDGCTSAAVSNDRQRFIIHNEDEAKDKPESGNALVCYADGRAAFIYAGELAGNAFGWGSDWFYCVNFLPVRRPNLRGIPRYFVSRKLLGASGVNEAVKLLKRADEASGFHYLMGDTSGRTVSVEKHLRTASVLEARSAYCHSNHYLHPKLRELEAFKTKNSAVRLEIARKNVSVVTGQSEILEVWRKELRRPIFKGDPARTFATVLADLKSRIISIF